MNINEQFPSAKYLKSADLAGNVAKVKIHNVVVEEVGTDRKMIMYFVGKEKGMVLNRTNARAIAEIYGEDTDSWIGAPIEVFSMKVDFQGKMVDGLRIRVPRVLPQRPAPVRDDWQAPPQGSVTMAPNARDRAQAASVVDDMDDGEIPF